MFSYRRRQNVKPNDLSGRPWLIGLWRFRPLVRMVDRCAAPLMTPSPSASASTVANRIPGADARVRHICASYNDFVSRPGGGTSLAVRLPQTALLREQARFRVSVLYDTCQFCSPTHARARARLADGPPVCGS